MNPSNEPTIAQLSDPHARSDDSDLNLNDPAVTRAVEEYRDLLTSGRPPSRAEFLARYPAIARELSACLDGLEFIQAAAPSLQEPRADQAADSPDAVRDGSELRLAMSLGDFRIIREIGRGGMGIVYEAEQLSLGRRVALKVLPFAGMMDSKQLQRFKNESHAAAQLHHQNIVPVYFVGSDRGVHYYAMQFIEGHTLAEVIRELGGNSRNEDPNKAIRNQVIGDHVSETPMLAQFDRSLITEHRSPSSTSAVAALSTARSTRPKEFFRTIARLGIQAAEALDHAHQVGIIHRDVKPSNLLLDVRGSLWITDFGLARIGTDANLTMTGDLIGTLRYMSPEQALAKRVVVDHRTDIYSLGVTLYELLTLQPAFPGEDRQELLRQVAFDEPRPPHKTNPSIPVELETIVLKAMSKSPDDRYATARELVEDLRRFNEDQPILARTPTPWKRLIKWTRRHQSVVTSVISVGLASLAIGSVLLWRSQAEALRQRDVAQAASRRADSKSKLAREVVDRMYTDVAVKWLANQPRMTKVQKEFLQQALQFYEELAREQGDDADVQFQQGRAYRRVGDIQYALGAPEEVERAYRQAVTIFQSLSLRNDAPVAFRFEWGNTLASLARLALETGRRKESERLYREALTIHEMHPLSFTQGRRALGEAHTWIGWLLKFNGQKDQAVEHLLEAIRIEESLCATPKSQPEDRFALARTNHWLGCTQRDAGELKAAAPHFRTAVELAESLCEDFPERPEYQKLLAYTTGSEGVFFQWSGQTEAAELSMKKCLAVQERLAKDFPAVPGYALDLARTLFWQGNLVERSRPEYAEDAYRRAIAIQERMPPQFYLQSDIPTSVYDELALSCRSLVYLLIRTERYVEAAKLCREVLASQEKMSAATNNDAGLRMSLAVFYARLAHLFGALGVRDDALDCFQRTLIILQSLTLEDQASREHSMAIAWNGAAWFLTDCADQSLRDPSRALEFAKKAANLAPDDPGILNTLGVAYYRAGEWQQAIDALQQSDAIDPTASWNCVFLAMAYRQLGDKGGAQRWYELAVESMEKLPNDWALRRAIAEAVELFEQDQ